jgi:sRNA-binding protein
MGYLNYKYSREEIGEGITFLAQKYPKCFFENPKQRLPVTKTIDEDLRADGASELLIDSADFYRTHYGYYKCLQAGAKRVDLDGNYAGTVTELESIVAERNAKEAEAKMNEWNERKRLIPPVEYGQPQPALSLNRQLSDFPQFIQKINQPQRPAMSNKPMITPAPVIHPTLTRVQDTVLATNAAISAVQNPAMLTTIIVAMMRVIIEEAQAVIDNASQTAA